MPQSPHRLRNDIKCVEWDVKPYYTLYTLSEAAGKLEEFKLNRERKGREEKKRITKYDTQPLSYSSTLTNPLNWAVFR